MYQFFFLQIQNIRITRTDRISIRRSCFVFFSLVSVPYKISDLTSSDSSFICFSFLLSALMDQNSYQKHIWIRSSMFFVLVREFFRVRCRDVAKPEPRLRRSLCERRRPHWTWTVTSASNSDDGDTNSQRDRRQRNAARWHRRVRPRSTRRLEIPISRVHVFTNSREINMRNYQTVYLKNPCTRVFVFKCFKVMITYFFIVTFNS